MSSLDEVMLDPQLAASGFFKRATHPSEGEILFTDQPVRFGDGVASSARLHAAARRVQRRNFTRSWSYRSRDPGFAQIGGDSRFQPQGRGSGMTGLRKDSFLRARKQSGFRLSVSSFIHRPLRLV